MTAEPASRVRKSTPRRISLLAVYLYLAAITLRIFLMMEDSTHTWQYLVASLFFIILFSISMWRSALPDPWMPLITAVLILLIIFIQTLEPEEDAANALFVIAGYQVGLVYKNRRRWMWVAIMALACGLSLVTHMGVLEGLAKSLLNIGGVIVLAAYFETNQEIDEARATSQVMLEELEQNHKKLQLYTSQVEELSAVQERNRLARELHDSVSQTMFSILLNIRSAQLLAAKNPGRLLPQLTLLQNLSQSALLEMRSLISELRPRKD